MDDDPETLRDRSALEAILGFAVDGEPWPDMALPPGTRVRIVQDPGWPGSWAAEFSGVIDCTRAPRPVMHRLAMPGELSYFVAFDEPQLDAAGGGPYRKASIWGRYLKSQAPP